MTPYMRAHFEIDQALEDIQRQAAARAAQQAQEAQQRAQALRMAVEKLNPILDQLTKDAAIIGRGGVVCKPQIFDSHAALSVKIGIVDLKNKPIDLGLTLRIEGSGEVNVAVSIKNGGYANSDRSVGSTDRLGSITDENIVACVEEGLYQAIMKAARVDAEVR